MKFFIVRDSIDVLSSARTVASQAALLHVGPDSNMASLGALCLLRGDSQ